MRKVCKAEMIVEYYLPYKIWILIKNGDPIIGRNDALRTLLHFTSTIASIA